MVKSIAERKAKERQEKRDAGYKLSSAQVWTKHTERGRLRKAGYVLRAIWIHPDDWPRIEKHLERLNARRKAQP
jgi:hypothetical protein